MTKFFIVLNIIFIGFLFTAVLQLNQRQVEMKTLGVKYEAKIKELDRSIQFGIMTGFGRDEQGMEVWNQLLKEGKVDRLFSWETNVKK